MAKANDGGSAASSAATGKHGRRGRRIPTIALEVLLISVGVFLALLGDQWRENRQHRQLALESLRHFQAEFAKNREAVAGVRHKHETGLDAIRQYLQADQQARRALAPPFESTDPAFLEYTAWDLALATQALDYVEPDLADAIAHVYAAQRQLDDATHAITQVLYQKVGGDFDSLLRSIAVYFGDCTLIEPRLLDLYDDILTRLDRALGGPPTGQPTH